MTTRARNFISATVSTIALVLLAASWSGCGDTTTRAATAAGLAGDSTRGAALFGSNCAACHGAMGEGTALGPDLSPVAGAPRDTNIQVMIDGNDNMPSFAGLSDQELSDLASFVATL